MISPTIPVMLSMFHVPHLTASQQLKLLPELQSAFRCCHSTETAVFKVLSDAFNAKLHLPDCWILLLHLTLSTMLYSSTNYGMCLVWSTVLWTGWHTWLDEHSMYYVHYNGEVSRTTPLYWGVPQGSVFQYWGQSSSCCM